MSVLRTGSIPGAVAALLLALTACDGGSAGSGSADAITIGSPGSSSDAGFYLADHRGYFRAVGLKVEYKQVSGGSDLIPLLSTGRLDVGGLSLNSGLINAVRSGNHLQLVADKGSFTDGSTPSYGAMLIRPSDASVIKGPADLRGRTIAVGSAGSSLDVAISGYLAQGGLTTKDVKITTLGQNQRVIALEQKAVDAAFVFEPFLSQALGRNAGVVLADGGAMARDLQVAGVVFGGPFVEEHPEQAQDFLSAYLCGVQDYNAAVRDGKDADAVLGIIADATGESVESLRRGIPIGLRSDGALNADDVQQTIDRLAANGLVTGPLSVDELINTRYAQNAQSCDEIRAKAKTS
ncbi:hypothetical protein DI005_21060 [Prauserella sp. PE36]|uniref:ABC transporter substrate-binding protein n=1 Tax=Prauserella sp. PE36 TaxID=1504709 RepID=UPI000DE36526|nr:ABC transporter substrate-binding protein [Prauserella sp. PE36]RBM17701.1 hypothetical protein DI005_21060 [Prauserella sp. PE36]